MGQQDFGSEVIIQIPKLGDLISKMYLKCDISLNGSNGKFCWINKIGHNIIKHIDIILGGDKIDRQYSEWFDLWYELTRNISQEIGYNKLIGNYDEMVNLSSNEKNTTIYLPFQFFFNKFYGLSLPLIALQYHKLRIEIKLNDFEKLYIKERSTIINGSISNLNLICNFIFLDNEENNKFAKNKHEYLIEQTQFSGINNVNSLNEAYILNFSHPCKVLYWFMRNGNFINSKYFLSYISEIDFLNNTNKKLINDASLRYIFSKMYSNDGLVYIKLDGSGNNVCNSETNLTYYEGSSIKTNDGLVEIQCNYESLIFISPNTANCNINNFDNWIVKKNLSIDIISQPIDSILVDSNRTNDINNLGHRNYDILVNQFNNYGKYIDYTCNPIISSQLRLNGHIRFTEQSSNFFNYLQAYETHKSSPKDGINLYSFSLYPLEHQPSGTCNFSKIDSTSLELKFDENIVSISDNQLYIFTLNYNILRFMNGMAAIAFNN